MPLPNPNPEEKQQEFMKRCITDPTMETEYPNLQQRMAVCYTQWRGRKRK